MALLTKTGSFALNTVTGNQAVTSVGFLPKVLILYITALTADGSAASWKTGIGFGVSSTSRAAVGGGGIDSAAVNQYSLSQSETSIIYVSDGIGGLLMSADLVSFDANGFTINITAAPASAFICNYVAIGGSDLTNTFIKRVDTPAATGSQAYTGVGFKPDALMVIGIRDNAALPQTGALDTTPSYSIGYGVGTTGLVSAAQKNDTAGNTKTAKKQTTNILNTLTSNNTDNEVATLTSLDADGFTFNWTSRSTTGRYFWVLCLKGGRYKVGTDTQKTDSTGTKATTGVGFIPAGLLVQSVDNVNSASVVAGMRLSFGAASGSASRGCIWLGDQDTVATTNSSSNLDRTNIIKMMSESHGSPTTQAAADLSSFDSDGFTLNWGSQDATAREFVYFAMGSNANVNDLLMMFR